MSNKQTLRSQVAYQFQSMTKIIKSAAEAKIAHRQALAKIQALSSEYNQDYIANKTADEKVRFANQWQAMQVDFDAQIEKMGAMLDELHGTLELNNPALANALQLIELGGTNLSSGTILKINSAFAGDQPALRALQAVYKGKGLPYDGGLDRQIYDPETALSSLHEFSRYAFGQDGSLNELAGAVGRIAKLEGQPFETMLDPQGAIDVMRHAAGLPEAKPE